jgi:hypothetical protein
MNKKKLIIGILISAIFVMVSFAPVANATNNTNQSVNTVTSDISVQPHASNLISKQINVVKYNDSINMLSNHIYMNMVFSVTNNTGNNQHITENGKFGNVSVFASGNRIYLNMTIIPSNKINKVPGDCGNIYYKFPKNHKAALSVTKLPVISGASDATIIAVFGAVISSGVGSLGGVLSSADVFAAGVFGSIIVPVVAALAVDYVALDIYASEHHDPTVYFDLGASWGTQWYNFYDVGVYGEEGAFTGTADSGSSGLYIPIVVDGPGSLSLKTITLSHLPHTGVWNPYEEPPW